MKKLEIQLNATIPDGVDLLDRYLDFKAAVIAKTGAIEVVTRSVLYTDLPDATKIVTFVTELTVADDFDPVGAPVADPLTADLEEVPDPLTEFRAAVSEALEAAAVDILSLTESAIIE